jgi:hypothetical protein
MNSHLIIRTCSHILPDGRHCRGAAVRGRARCRHHLDARTRLHNMARAGRRTLILRWRVPDSRRDLARNRAEVSRVVATGRIDFDTARMLFWAMDLTAASLPAEPTTRFRRSHNSNVSYHVSLNPLFTRSCTGNPSQVPENTSVEGRGVSPCSRLGNPTGERVGFLQPRRGDRSKPSSSAPATKLDLHGCGRNGIAKVQVPEARNSLAQHEAAGGVLGQAENFIRVPEARQNFAAARSVLRNGKRNAGQNRDAT